MAAHCTAVGATEDLLSLEDLIQKLYFPLFCILIYANKKKEMGFLCFIGCVLFK